MAIHVSMCADPKQSLARVCSWKKVTTLPSCNCDCSLTLPRLLHILGCPSHTWAMVIIASQKPHHPQKGISKLPDHHVHHVLSASKRMNSEPRLTGFHSTFASACTALLRYEPCCSGWGCCFLFGFCVVVPCPDACQGDLCLSAHMGPPPVQKVLTCREASEHQP